MIIRKDCFGWVNKFNIPYYTLYIINACNVLNRVLTHAHAVYLLSKDALYDVHWFINKINKVITINKKNRYASFS